MFFRSGKLVRPLVASICSATIVLGVSLSASAEEPNLPDTMTWSSYDVGSAGYAEASAIADAFGKNTGPVFAYSRPVLQLADFSRCLVDVLTLAISPLKHFLLQKGFTTSPLAAGGRKTCEQ